jgi:leader peptidase (prepilin peptidase) / N-methyltransferase
MNILPQVFLFVLGTAIGSFLNVLIDRLPKEESINGRSHCDYCKKKLSALDLIPVFSFIALKGKCRYCKKKLSYFYPFVEVLTGVVFVLVWNFAPIQQLQQADLMNMYKLFGLSKFTTIDVGMASMIFQKILYVGMASTIIAIFFADLKYHVIPDSLQFVIGILILLLHIVMPSKFLPDLLAGVIIMSPILILFLITRGKGMGFGDVKLAFLIGFLLGLKGGFWALYIAFIVGALVGAVLLIIGKKKMKSKIAFGPYLLLGMVTLLFFPQPFFDLSRTLWGW